MQIKWIDAQDEFLSWFQGKNNYVHAFEDAREAMGVAQSRRVFTKGQPADYLVTSSGVTFFAEVKSSQAETSFPLSGIRKPQWHAAKLCTAAKGLYYFYIRSEVLHQWYKVPAIFFVEIEAAGVKSVKWSQLESFKYANPSQT